MCFVMELVLETAAKWGSLGCDIVCGDELLESLFVYYIVGDFAICATAISQPQLSILKANG